MSRQLRLGPPPTPLRTAKLDNLALLPGSELDRIARYQEMANELPDGGVLIVLPSSAAKQKPTLLSVARSLTEQGHKVRVIAPRERARASIGQTRIEF